MQRGTLCLHCGFEGGNYLQFFWPCFRFFCAFEEFPGIPRKCRPEVNGWDFWNGIKTTLNKSHVSVVSRLARLHTNRSWLCEIWDVCRMDARNCGVWCGG